MDLESYHGSLHQVTRPSAWMGEGVVEFGTNPSPLGGSGASVGAGASGARLDGEPGGEEPVYVFSELYVQERRSMARAWLMPRGRRCGQRGACSCSRCSRIRAGYRRELE